MHDNEKRHEFIEVRLSLLPQSEGGRDEPVASGYMPNWRLPGSPDRVLASAKIELLDTDVLVPGSTATVRVHTFFPAIWDGVEIGDELDVTEGPRRTIGRAVVTRIVPVAIPAGQSSS